MAGPAKPAQEQPLPWEEAASQKKAEPTPTPAIGGPEKPADAGQLLPWEEARTAGSKISGGNTSTEGETEKPGILRTLWNDASAIFHPVGVSPYPGMDSDVKSELATEEAQRDQSRKAAGYSLPYRIAAPVAESVGVNVPGMEEAARRGNERAVIGHALAPIALMSAGAALEHGGPRVVDSLSEGTPKALVTAPVRIGARTAEGVVNSSPLRYVRGAARIMTPADTARRMIRVPGRDFGLDLPSYPGAPLPAKPDALVFQARGLQTGALPIGEPSEALARIPVHPAEPETSLALRPKGKIGGRLILSPEEVQQSEQMLRIAKRRASERGMQYAAGMKPSGGKIAAP